MVSKKTKGWSQVNMIQMCMPCSQACLVELITAASIVCLVNVTILVPVAPVFLAAVLVCLAAVLLICSSLAQTSRDPGIAQGRQWKAKRNQDRPREAANVLMTLMMVMKIWCVGWMV